MRSTPSFVLGLCIATVTGFALLTGFGLGCAQPVINCTSAHGPFAAVYTLTEGDPDSPCGQLEGDVLGMTTYFQPGGANQTPNYQAAKLAIRPASLGARLLAAEARAVFSEDDPDRPEVAWYELNAIGPFTAGFPDDDGFCHVDTFSPARLSLPELPEVPDDPETPEQDESLPPEPAVDVVYQWSDARLLVTADAQGTQFEADLAVELDGCRAQYHVVGLYPAVACESDADCEDEANGINPDFAVRCADTINLCVLDHPLPAYESGAN